MHFYRPLTHMTCFWGEPASLTWSWWWGPDPTGSEAKSGLGLRCSSSSTGWCCSRTPCGRLSARWARCRTRWRCRWAGRTPAAWAAGPSRAARRKSCPLSSSRRPCKWKSGTGRQTSTTRFVFQGEISQWERMEKKNNSGRIVTSWKKPTLIAGCSWFPWTLVGKGEVNCFLKWKELGIHNIYCHLVLTSPCPLN